MQKRKNKPDVFRDQNTRIKCRLFANKSRLIGYTISEICSHNQDTSTKRQKVWLFVGLWERKKKSRHIDLSEHI